MGFLDSIGLLARSEYHSFGHLHTLRLEAAKAAADKAKAAEKAKLQPDLVHPADKRTLLESLPAISPMQNALTPPQSHR